MCKVSTSLSICLVCQKLPFSVLLNRLVYGYTPCCQLYAASERRKKLSIHMLVKSPPPPPPPQPTQKKHPNFTSPNEPAKSESLPCWLFHETCTFIGKYLLAFHITSDLFLYHFYRKLWLSILTWIVFGLGMSFAVIPVYSDIYGIAK